MSIDALSALQGRGELVLLAEDEELVRRAAIRILERNGYSVLPAEDGQHAMELFAANADEVRLVITDVLMPRMGARGLVEFVRSLRPSMPVLCTSGYAEGKSDPERMIPDDVPFLLKPWRTNDLLVQLRALLDAPSALI